MGNYPNCTRSSIDGETFLPSGIANDCTKRYLTLLSSWGARRFARRWEPPHVRFFHRIKTRHRRMTGLRSWNRYIWRGGEFVLLVIFALAVFYLSRSNPPRFSIGLRMTHLRQTLSAYPLCIYISTIPKKIITCRQNPAFKHQVRHSLEYSQRVNYFRKS
ncbi:hypothetical protein PATY110618_09860 [Paenibacillus typhae]|uniref:Uncharacterized protein n=1 Tax=Paenibacillus typhae TaxID=1174501 RepID=A0A1G8P6M0_9BACL|nr:hypothetical protein SAMN05216192_109103 [Paenibacillus typhae]